MIQTHSLVTPHSSLVTDMVPWPIAALTLFYGAMAAAASAAVWKVLMGAVQRPLIWPLAWLGLSAAAAYGLPLLKPWARAVAIAGAWLMAVTTLSLAALLITGGKPVVALGATLGTLVYLVIIRYLGRPTVKAYFNSRI